jgi:hypothetical protein
MWGVNFNDTDIEKKNIINIFIKLLNDNYINILRSIDNIDLINTNNKILNEWKLEKEIEIEKIINENDRDI